MFQTCNFYVYVALQVLNLNELIFLNDNNFRLYWQLKLQNPQIYKIFEDHNPDVHDLRKEVWWERNEEIVNQVVMRRTGRMTRRMTSYSPY